MTSKRAQSVLDWADTAFYVFCLVLAAVVAVVLLVHSWGAIGPPAIPL